MLVLEGLIGLHRTVQLQLLQCYWLGHRLGLPWYWMVCLGNEHRSFCRFWDCIQVLHFGLFCSSLETIYRSATLTCYWEPVEMDCLTRGSKWEASATFCQIHQVRRSEGSAMIYFRMKWLQVVVITNRTRGHMQSSRTGSWKCHIIYHNYISE